MSDRKSYKDLEMVVFDMAGTTLQIGGLIPVALKEGFLEEGIAHNQERLENFFVRPNHTDFSKGIGKIDFMITMIKDIRFVGSYYTAIR